MKFDTSKPLRVHVDLGRRKWHTTDVSEWWFDDNGIGFRAEAFPHHLCYYPWTVVKMIEQLPERGRQSNVRAPKS